MNSRVYSFEFDDFVSEERRKYLVVVIYDIVDNNKRARFAKYLKGFGVRVQKSAFECILQNRLYERLIKGITNFAGDEDLIRVYRIASNADVRVFGNIGKVTEEEVVII